MPNKRLLTRRRTLWLGLGTLVGTSCSVKDKVRDQRIQLLARNDLHDDLNRDFTVVGQASLKSRAAAKGLIYGAESAYNHLSLDADFAASILQECSLLMHGGLKWYMPPHPLRPNPNTFDFTAGDWMAEFAKRHNLLFRGHALVYHVNLPPWFKESVNQQNAMQFLVKHTETVAKHFTGRMHSWDVVNEAIEPGSGRSDGLRNTPWLKFLGPDYIKTAFYTAAEADPQAMLIYSDNGLEYDTRYQEAKRTATLKMLEQLKSSGTPIHGLGIQAHLGGQEINFNAKKLRSFLQNVADLGLKIMLTEMDVTDKALPQDIKVRDRIVASAYEDFLSVVLDEPAVMAIVTFGLSDRYTWLSDFAPRNDGHPVRPLPLDAQLRRKLAWKAMARAFDNAPARKAKS